MHSYSTLLTYGMLLAIAEQQPDKPLHWIDQMPVEQGACELAEYAVEVYLDLDEAWHAADLDPSPEQLARIYALEAKLEPVRHLI